MTAAPAASAPQLRSTGRSADRNLALAEPAGSDAAGWQVDAQRTDFRGEGVDAWAEETDAGPEPTRSGAEATPNRIEALESAADRTRSGPQRLATGADDPATAPEPTRIGGVPIVSRPDRFRSVVNADELTTEIAKPLLTGVGQRLNQPDRDLIRSQRRMNGPFDRVNATRAGRNVANRQAATTIGDLKGTLGRPSVSVRGRNEANRQAIRVHRPQQGPF